MVNIWGLHSSIQTEVPGSLMSLRAKLPIPEKATEGAGSLFRTLKTDAKVAFILFGDLFFFDFPPTQWLRNTPFSGKLCHSCWHDRSGIDRPVTCRLWVTQQRHKEHEGSSQNAPWCGWHGQGASRICLCTQGTAVLWDLGVWEAG